MKLSNTDFTPSAFLVIVDRVLDIPFNSCFITSAAVPESSNLFTNFSASVEALPRSLADTLIVTSLMRLFDIFHLQKRL